MAWFRRRSPRPVEADGGLGSAEPACIDADVTALVPSAAALARTEHALVLLASQASQTQRAVTRLESQVDLLSAALLDRLELPAQAELEAARRETAKVAAELARLEINLAARMDAVRDIVSGAGDDGGHVIDLRTAVPTDTGWDRRRA